MRRRTEDPSIRFEQAEQSEQFGVVLPLTLDEPRPERLVVLDVAKGERLLEVDPSYGGTRVHPPPRPRTAGGTAELSGHQEQLGHSRG